MNWWRKISVQRVWMMTSRISLVFTNFIGVSNYKVFFFWWKKRADVCFLICTFFNKIMMLRVNINVNRQSLSSEKFKRKMKQTLIYNIYFEMNNIVNWNVNKERERERDGNQLLQMCFDIEPVVYYEHSAIP